MLLQEILAGTNKKIVKKTDEFWVLYNVPKIHFFPRYSNSWDADLQKFYGGDELGDDPTWEQLKPIRAKISKLTKVDYSDQNQHGWFLVTKGTVNFDVSRFSSSQNRRRNTPMSKEHKDKNGEVPILMGELTFGRIIDMVKVLKALVKVKPETAKYTVVGDDRVRGQTVEQVIGGAGAKYDQTKVFSAGTLKELVMFHGTSEKRADQVLKTGLRPSQRGSVYSDMIDGYSQRNVYLASSPGTAANYATREAINDGSDAAILQVTLNPMQVMKLLPDEDTMSWFEYLPKEYKQKLHSKYPMLAEIWDDEKSFNVHIKNMNHSEKKFNLEWLWDELDHWQKDDGWRPKAIAVLKKNGYDKPNLEPIEKALYIDIMNTFIDSAKVRSLKKSGLAAYPGTIPSKQLKLVKTWSLKGTKTAANGTQAEYNAASEKQEKSAKYH